MSVEAIDVPGGLVRITVSPVAPQAANIRVAWQSTATTRFVGVLPLISSDDPTQINVVGPPCECVEYAPDSFLGSSHRAVHARDLPRPTTSDCVLVLNGALGGGELCYGDILALLAGFAAVVASPATLETFTGVPVGPSGIIEGNCVVAAAEELGVPLVRASTLQGLAALLGRGVRMARPVEPLALEVTNVLAVVNGQQDARISDKILKVEVAGKSSFDLLLDSAAEIALDGVVVKTVSAPATDEFLVELAARCASGKELEVCRAIVEQAAAPPPLAFKRARMLRADSGWHD